MGKEILTTAEQVRNDLVESNGSPQTLALIRAGVPRVGVMGDTLVCARLSNRTDEEVRPALARLLKQYYPGFNAANVMIEDEATWNSARN